MASLMLKKRAIDVVSGVLFFVGGAVLIAGMAAKSERAQFVGAVMCGAAYLLVLFVLKRIAVKDGGRPTWRWMPDLNNLKARDVTLLCVGAILELALVFYLFSLWSH